MSTLFRTLASSTGLIQCLLDLTTWLLARMLQMPEPMVHAAALFLLLRLQAIENEVGNGFYPIRLLRALLSRHRDGFRPPRGRGRWRICHWRCR
jgi:hypothetical protein